MPNADHAKNCSQNCSKSDVNKKTRQVYSPFPGKTCGGQQIALAKQPRRAMRANKKKRFLYV